MNKRIIEWLERIKSDNNVNSSDLAEVAGVSPQAVSKWLKTGSIGLESIEKLSFEYNVPFELGVTGKPSPIPEHVAESIRKAVKSSTEDAISMGWIELREDLTPRMFADLVLLKLDN